MHMFIALNLICAIINLSSCVNQDMKKQENVTNLIDAGNHILTPQDIGKVPDGWINCPRESRGIIAGKFVVFKTPLDEVYYNQIPQIYRFDVENVYRSMSMKKVHLGLWVDLTNTDRYFNEFKIKHIGCEYVKLPCSGKRVAPTREQVYKFIDICWNFLRENPSKTIGVHCTHGYNRTGFMVICYLIEIFNFTVTQAVNMFAAFRPPGIYRQYLINELYKRYSHEEPTKVPRIPLWYFRRFNNTRH